MKWQIPEVIAEVGPNGLGLLTLNRPQALNALNLPMVRALSEVLHHWHGDPAIRAVALRGNGKQGAFGVFCAGGDIRFFHQAALAGDPALDDFFTEEYALNHLIHRYPKPFIAFMDGVVMGGGMGLCQGASLRIVTERTRMAMPETQIGLFPDVGGGYFLSRCPGHVGEYLALTGEVIGAAEALASGLADVVAPSDRLDAAWQALQRLDLGGLELAVPPDSGMAGFAAWMEQDGWTRQAARPTSWLPSGVEAAFAHPSVPAIALALQQAGTEAAARTLDLLRSRSPLMLHVALEQVRRGRTLSLADDLRMERDLVRHCFDTVHLQRRGAASETVEGIRALAVDKDRQPHWLPARIEDVTPEMVVPFFVSPWPAWAHPLRHLAG